VVAADDKVAVGFVLSGGNAADGPKGRELAESLGYGPVVHPKRNRRDPWAYDGELYKKRNEVERFFLQA